MKQAFGSRNRERALRFTFRLRNTSCERSECFISAHADASLCKKSKFQFCTMNSKHKNAPLCGCVFVLEMKCACRRMKNEAGLCPMKQAFGSQNRERALRFTANAAHGAGADITYRHIGISAHGIKNIFIFLPPLPIRTAPLRREDGGSRRWPCAWSKGGSCFREADE